jgi:hypothetical protein
MDKLVGGPGLRRGRRHSERVTYGEALDFWRVIGVEKDKSLKLLAEMNKSGFAVCRLCSLSSDNCFSPAGDDYKSPAFRKR